VVTGLDIFQSWFEDYSDQYVLIGGTAASIAMERVGQEFRRTKDLDVVLHVEALTPEFGKHFWEFVSIGEYATRQSSVTGRPQLYRFLKPTDERFPYMVELFARAPVDLILKEGSQLAPIPFDEKVSSLSAILLDDEYYDFLMNGRQAYQGLPWAGEDRLIPLKARAWLDLTARKQDGEKIDSKTIAKHLKDVLILSGLLSPADRIDLSTRIANDLLKFIQLVSQSNLATTDQRVIEILDRIRLVYGLKGDITLLK
jgi:hypothetical protein